MQLRSVTDAPPRAVAARVDHSILDTGNGAGRTATEVMVTVGAATVTVSATYPSGKFRPGTH